MAPGLDKFRETLSRYNRNFVIIGGSACDVMLPGTLMVPRATLDIDMVLIVENMTSEFGTAFWNLVL